MSRHDLGNLATKLEDAPFVKIMLGDTLNQLKTLPDESVHCCITSPPYWGLRDYNIAGQIGVEATPEEFIQKLVEVFREVRRVLRSDGTCWINMGDCYSAVGKSGGGEQGDAWEESGQKTEGSRRGRWRPAPAGLKQKDLVGQPWRLAFALQEDGWYLRSDIIWSKPNPMPESVIDRPSKSHEYIFLLSKSPRYYYDREAIREPNAPSTENNASKYTLKLKKGLSKDRTPGEQMAYFCNPLGRNARTVWEIPTQPFSGAHFATFPEELPRRCIKAGTSERGCCSICGAPWIRILEPTPNYAKILGIGNHGHDHDRQKGNRINGKARKNIKPGEGWVTKGWRPSCDCSNNETTPSIVLDPFGGSGTTGMVARSMGRSSILIELNPEYIRLIEDRTDAKVPALSAFKECVTQ